MLRPSPLAPRHAWIACRMCWLVLVAATAWLLRRMLCPLRRVVGRGWQTGLGFRDEVRVRLGAALVVERLGEYLAKQAAFDAHYRNRTDESQRREDAH